MREEIIRAYMLEVNDIFKLGHTFYRVSKIENDVIYYHRYYPENSHSKINGSIETMGANNHERIILITIKR